MFNWNANTLAAGGAGSVIHAVKRTPAITVQANLLRGSFRITGITDTSGIRQGMKVVATGIPAGTVVINVEANALRLSRAATSSPSGATVTISNGSATLVTSHSNGFNGNWPGLESYRLDSGVNYIFNAATGNPFPASVGSLHAGDMDIAANVMLNTSISVGSNLRLQEGNLTIPANHTVLMAPGAVISGAPFSNTKHIITATDANGSQGFLGATGFNNAFLFPVGTTAAYLPLTITPAGNASFLVNAFEGMTLDGKPGGTAFSPAQKQYVVDAVWVVTRLDNNNDSCQFSLAWPQSLEGNSFSLGNNIGLSFYNDDWNAAGGIGNNATNTASRKGKTLSAIAVASTGVTPGQTVLLRTNNNIELAVHSNETEAVSYRLYPNPATDILVVEHTLKQRNVFIVVYDALGRAVVKARSAHAKTSLDIAALMRGRYTIVLSDGTHTLSGSFIKQ